MLYELTTTELATQSLLDFDEPFSFAYTDWQDGTQVVGSAVSIEADTVKGGAGYNLTRGIDYSLMADRCPVLKLSLAADHQAKAIRLLLFDSLGKKGIFAYNLENQPKN